MQLGYGLILHFCIIDLCSSRFEIQLSRQEKHPHTFTHSFRHPLNCEIAVGGSDHLPGLSSIASGMYSGHNAITVDRMIDDDNAPEVGTLSSIVKK